MEKGVHGSGERVNASFRDLTVEFCFVFHEEGLVVFSLMSKQ
jgi:hypothetical protein